MGTKSLLQQVYTEETDTIHRDETELTPPQDEILSTTQHSTQGSAPVQQQFLEKEEVRPAEKTILFLGQDPYLYEWFRLSILMATLFTCLKPIFILAYSSINSFNLPVLLEMLEDVAVLFSCLFVWMLCFVVTGIARFSNKQAQRSAIVNHRAQSSAPWKRSTLYLLYLVFVLGGMGGASSHFWIFTVFGSRSV